jgi:hypothetical protein
MSFSIKKDKQLLTINEKNMNGISDKIEYEQWLLNPIEMRLEVLIAKNELFMYEEKLKKEEKEFKSHQNKEEKKHNKESKARK